MVALFAALLHGTNVEVLNPKGLIADSQFGLILFSTLVLLGIAVPSLFCFYFFAWKYRETNTKATYEPNKPHGKWFVFNMWAIPCAIMLILAVVMWIATHKLDPRRAIDSKNKTLVVQVIALRWKWLFIYPEQGIATVNYVQAPVNTPIEFDLTADDAPMSSFWIPSWGGQLYAMTGHSNQLHLMPTTKGDFTGSSAELNGAGFAGMKFTARASSQADFNEWVTGAQQSKDVLDWPEYQKLLQPTENNKAAVYSSTEQDMYGTVLMKYMGSHHMGTSHTEQQ
ncbi:MAG TPA: COX aromatic rich motif-containing protein [Candidatus Saccharimonadales bacterium]|nr:COX aromatic rich motif-containing protein [Candidatus Saccharimonadales bacterium]